MSSSDGEVPAIYGTPPEQSTFQPSIHCDILQRVLGIKSQSLSARTSPSSLLVYLCELYCRLSDETQRSTFVSLSFEMWCLLYVIPCDLTISVSSELRYLLQVLAALGYYGGDILSILDCKLVLDLRTGTSLCLPQNDYYVVDTYSDARSIFLSKVSDLININYHSNYVGPYSNSDVHTVHYRGNGACEEFRGLSSSPSYSGAFDVDGITVFNESGICPDLCIRIQSVDKLLRPFKAFAEHAHEHDSDDVSDEAGSSATPPGFYWDHNCGTPQLVPILDAHDVPDMT
jgi:hypothetical protein